MTDATTYLTEATEDADFVQRWAVGLHAAVGSLSFYPRRYVAVERESRQLGVEIRRMLFRHTPGGVAYHVFYRVQDTSEDGPFVLVVHVRHASRQSLTRKEAQEIRSEL